MGKSRNDFRKRAAVQRGLSAGSRQTDELSKAGHAPEDAYLNPQTCCSNCLTVFEVSPALLSSSDTRVRCGECLCIFDALANLRNSDIPDEDLLRDVEASRHKRRSSLTAGAMGPGQAGLTVGYRGVSSLPDASSAALAGLTRNTSSLDVTYTDMDLFSVEAGLPEVAYFDQTRDTPTFDYDDFPDDIEESFSDALFARDVTVDTSSTRDMVNDELDIDELGSLSLTSDVDYVTDEVPREAIDFRYRERDVRAPLPPSLPTSADDSRPVQGAGSPVTSAGPHASAAMVQVEPALAEASATRNAWWLRSFLMLIVVLLASALYGYRERATLLHNPSLRPWLDSACSLLKCTLPPMVDLASLKVLQRSVFSHPTLNNALVIDLSIINQAAFSQRYPVLHIRLTDRNGREVVSNDFEPADYLDSWQEGDVLDAGKRLNITLPVEDPGRTAVSFELDFH